MYKFRYIEFSDGEKQLIIDFEDKSKAILSEFLMSEVGDFGEIIVPLIDKVLSGESEFEEFSGNGLGIEISKDKSKIYSALDSRELEDFIITTKELRYWIDIWFEKLEEFNKTGEI